MGNARQASKRSRSKGKKARWAKAQQQLEQLPAGARARISERNQINKAKAIADRQAVQRDLNPLSDETHGTFLTAEVKRNCEEAQHVVCCECGSSAGRHMRGCSRA